MSETFTIITTGIGTVLTTGGFVVGMFIRQQRLIESKVSMEVHTEVCGHMEKTIKEFRDEQKEMREVLGDVREAVARIDERTEMLKGNQ